MKFGLFVVLNALMLIRPEELFPEITGLRLYLIVIALCALLPSRHVVAALPALWMTQTVFLTSKVAIFRAGPVDVTPVDVVTH